jgi:predicted PurR-regulated permease PerM
VGEAGVTETPSSMSDIDRDRLRRPPFYILVLVAIYLTYQVLGPFLVPLAWAAVFAMIFHRSQVSLETRIGSNRAALLLTVLTGLLIVLPAVLLVTALAREAVQVADYVQQSSLITPYRIERIWEAIRARTPFELPPDPTQLLRDGISRILTFLAPRAGAVVADLFATLGTLFAMLFAMFFLLRDGEVIGRELRSLLPLPPAQSERLIRSTRDLVIASVGAGVVVAVAQGTIGGLAFWALGLGAPAFWAVVMAFCSLIPVVGAALVWVPAALWLLLAGSVGKGIAMAVIGVLGISMSDNVLRPLLLSGSTQVNGLVIFFGLLGGVAAFGFIGLVLGPVILVVTTNLLRMFARPDLVEISTEPAVETAVEPPVERTVAPQDEAPPAQP